MSDESEKEQTPEEGLRQGLLEELPDDLKIDPLHQKEATQLFHDGKIENDDFANQIAEEIGDDLTAQIDSSNMMMFEPYSPDEVFRCTNLTKSYGHGAAYTEVIKGISFTVKESEYVVIFGPSGSGKSTLLHLLAGLEVPSKGDIRVRGELISKYTDDEVARYHRQAVGMVFQKFNLIETLSVWENVAFPLMISGAPLDWREHEALKMLDKFNMADFANHLPSQLSGGQQQRVSLARALINDPDILLIDEPTGNLDSASASLVIDEIERLHKQEQRTIILVTHSQVFLPFATRVFYIKDGTLSAGEQKKNQSKEGLNEQTGVNTHN